MINMANLKKNTVVQGERICNPREGAMLNRVVKEVPTDKVTSHYQGRSKP